jgi:Ca2+-binding EF-hand superfamily protein
LTIYFIEIVFHRRYNSKDNAAWKSKKISLDEFISLINDACYFITYKPPRDTLIFIFRELDTDRDGFITFTQYADFIRKYLGNGIDPFAKPPPQNNSPSGISDEEYGFVNAIWDELKVYFNKYDQGKKGFLTESELRSFVV